MPNVSRPDLLPLALPKRIGLPFHGICRDGVLTMADATTRAYPQPTGSSVTYIKSPLAALPNRTEAEIAHDTEMHYEWLDYAYMVGTTRQLGGTNLPTDSSGATGISWIYCNAFGSWLVRAILSGTSGSTRTVTVAYKQFGVFRPDGETPDWTTLTSSVFNILHPVSGAPVSTISCIFDGPAVTHSQDGAKTAINFGTSASAFQALSSYCGAMKVEMATSETGVISATITTLASGTDLLEDNSGFTGTTSSWPMETDPDFELVAQDGSGNDGWYFADTSTSPLTVYYPAYSESYANTTTSDVKYNLYWFVTPAGTYKNIYSRRVTKDDVAVQKTISGIQILDAYLDYEYNAQYTSSWSWSFGIEGGEGVSYTFDGGYSHGALYTSDSDCVLNTCVSGQYANSNPTDALDGVENGMFYSGFIFFSTAEQYDGIYRNSWQSLTDYPIKGIPRNNNCVDFFARNEFDDTEYYCGTLDIFGNFFNLSDKTDDILMTELKNVTIDPRTEARYVADEIGQTICII